MTPTKYVAAVSGQVGKIETNAADFPSQRISVRAGPNFNAVSVRLFANVKAMLHL